MFGKTAAGGLLALATLLPTSAAAELITGSEEFRYEPWYIGISVGYLYGFPFGDDVRQPDAANDQFINPLGVVFGIPVDLGRQFQVDVSAGLLFEPENVSVYDAEFGVQPGAPGSLATQIALGGKWFFVDLGVWRPYTGLYATWTDSSTGRTEGEPCPDDGGPCTGGTSTLRGGRALFALKPVIGLRHDILLKDKPKRLLWGLFSMYLEAAWQHTLSSEFEMLEGGHSDPIQGFTHIAGGEVDLDYLMCTFGTSIVF